ncbi:D-alanyl-D-alanine carboxypeptidase/D-alanyl-D-alanine-endopeptidase [Balneolaceae bacterium YR4-1]|uniref:D-alanyl-D-alanine carboxypeptidase/D-alanyl-D-alanine-endopeptidase n=1 Tax=Halalkalibaculum roseum TaxID=2709311 RepID=A0A6M1T4E3_9BACT|nr:D-alanyl-D-alanine carboxypeptidase/D-alanyl-D-alanine-endopeptidase [Halalkalibaculum roseum]NGP76865.1 D-alanyl-D-alanine carboxypeptidase/D-alanyl-D-alanine-endopeptidase [Halalkalibaculum roseum]
MNKQYRHLIITALLISVCIPGRAQSIIFSPDVVQTIENSEAYDAFWSVIVRDSTGRILEGYNFDKLVQPASNLKLLSSATILDELGEDFTYKTRMLGFGYQEGGTWQGDIIIEGVGDPSISGTFYNEDRFHVLEKFYTAIDTLGIRKISGNLIGNTAYFDQQPYPKGWSWEDLSFYYGVEISALSFNENAVDLTVVADNAVGETPEIRWFPFDTDYVNFINEQVITPSNTEYDEFYRRILGTNTIILRSKVPQNYVEKESLSVLNAPMYFMDTFKKYLNDGGISLGGRIIIDEQVPETDDDDYTMLSMHESVPVGKMLAEINKESSNFFTEMMLKTAAAEHYDVQGTTDLGLTLIKDFAASMQMDTTKIELNDGSGMAPATLITPEDLTSLMVKMQNRSDFDTYKKSLSLAGIDGSLQHRFKGTPLYKKIYGKTGYVSGVRALSGYMTADTGKPLIFSIITNNHTEKTSYIDSLHESILLQIYEKY